MPQYSKEAVTAAMQGRLLEVFSDLVLIPCGRERKALCPFHEEKTPSFCVSPEAGLWNCFGCGKGGDVFDYVMQKESVDFPAALAFLSEKFGVSAEAAPKSAKVVATYDYTDADGTLLYQVVRLQPKTFFQRRPDGKGGWIKDMKGMARVLYQLPEVLKARAVGKVIHIVEGEKDVLALRAQGMYATCNSGGAGKWDASYDEVLRDAAIVILPDNDDMGKNHAENVAASLFGVAKAVKVVGLPNLPPKGDVSDWLDAGGTSEELQKIIRAIPPWTPKPSQLEEEAENPKETEKPAVPRISRPPTLNDAALYGLAGDIVRTIEPHTEADPAALLIQFLVAFGSIIGRSAHFRAEADNHYCNLYVVLVGQSSKARKGTSWGYIKRLFERVAPDWVGGNIVSGLSSGEGLIHAVRDCVEKDVKDKDTGDMTTTVVDPGVDDKRRLVQESEFASVLKVAGRDGNTLSAILRGFWDSGDAQTMTKREPARATGAHISIVGHITREELRRDLSATDSLNGFGNRFLWCFICRSKKLPEGGNLDEGKLSPLVYLLNKTIDAASKMELLKRDENARNMWARVYDDLSEGKPGLAGAVTSRAEAQVMRLATLYALLDCETEVRREHLIAALALWEYSEESAHHIFGGSLGDPVADEILDKLRDTPEGLTRTAIRDVFHKNQTSSRIEQALSLLAECGKAKYRMTKTGGKSAETWFAVLTADSDATSGAKA